MISASFNRSMASEYWRRAIRSLAALKRRSASTPVSARSIFARNPSAAASPRMENTMIKTVARTGLAGEVSAISVPFVRRRMADAKRSENVIEDDDSHQLPNVGAADDREQLQSAGTHAL